LGYNLVEGAQLVSLTPSDTSVISIDENGRLTAISEGTSTITAVGKITTPEGDLERPTTWTVNVEKQMVNIIPSSYEIRANSVDTLNFETNVLPSTLTWYVKEFDGNSILTVNNGRIRGISPGEVTVVVETESGYKDYCTIKVKRALVNQAEKPGGALSFEQLTNPPGENCYAFVLNRVNGMQLGFSTLETVDTCDVEVAAIYLEKDLKALNVQFERLSSVNDEVYDNEYRIAFRVRTVRENDYKVIYHLMVQTSSGAWAEKKGSSVIIHSLEEGLHPSPEEITWTETDYPEDNLEYYDSATIYYAINISNINEEVLE